jgi:dTDP-4-amino-4,6-dideoxygalactose transaminase
MVFNREFLAFAQPMIGPEEIREVVAVLKSRWITTGPKTRQFESEFARYVGCKNAIAVNSCTAALHLALEAIGIKPGDKIVTSPMTFTATTEVMTYLGAKPLFVDIDPATLNMDVNRLEELIKRTFSRNRKSNLKAIVPVHYGGYPCPMDDILRLAREYGIKIIEDAAHAFPAYYRGRMVGTIGDVTCFSFYATKTITIGEGGMITTGEDALAERMRIMSLHGISKDAWKRYRSDGSWYYEVIAPGFKYNLTDMAAALGLAQLRKAAAFRQKRAAIAKKYDRAFAKMDEIEIPGGERDDFHGVPSEDKGNFHSWHLYVIKLKPGRLSIDRDVFIEKLKQKRIGTSVHFIPLHIHPYYQKAYGFKPDDFPVAYRIYKRIVSLPIYPGMGNEDVRRVVDAVGDIIAKNRRMIPPRAKLPKAAPKGR